MQLGGYASFRWRWTGSSYRTPQSYNLSPPGSAALMKVDCTAVKVFLVEIRNKAKDAELRRLLLEDHLLLVALSGDAPAEMAYVIIRQLSWRVDPLLCVET